MSRRKWFKAAVAMLALVSMLMESGYEAYATVASDYVGETFESPIEVVSDVPVETPADIPVEVPVEVLPETDNGISTENSGDIVVEQPDFQENSDLGMNITYETETLADAWPEAASLPVSVNAYDDCIEILNADDFVLHINTDQMNSRDQYEVIWTGSSALTYDPVFTNFMNKGNGGMYYISGLNKELLNLCVNMSEGMSVEYSVREDGDPQITLISAPDPEIAKDLFVTEAGTEIIGEGYENITVSFVTEDLPDDVYFDLVVNSAADVTCDGYGLTDGKVTSLFNQSQSVTLNNLDFSSFSLRVVGENVDYINAVYAIDSKENGAVRITVSEADGAEKVQKLSVNEFGIIGSGYDKIDLSLAYLANVAGLDESDENEAPDTTGLFEYDLFVDTLADAYVNGQAVTSSGIRLDDTYDNVIIDGLDEEYFEIYAVPVEKDEIWQADASYALVSEEDGSASVEFTYDVELATKTVYEYEDGQVYVKAVLQNADAVPDSAQFSVKQVTSTTVGYNYDAYMQALNNNAEAILDEVDPEEDAFTDDNILMYDIAFLMDEDGSLVEYQPKEGTVRISINFKSNQLTEDIEAEEAEDIMVMHLPLIEEVKESVETTADATAISENDVIVEVVASNVSVEGGESVEFTASDFSIFTIYNQNRTAVGKVDVKNPGNESSEDVLGDAWLYGITANTWKFNGEAETSFAVKKLTGKNGPLGGGQTGVNSSKAEGSTTQYIMVGQVDGWTRIKGYPASIIIPQSEKGKLSHELNNGINFAIKSQSDINSSIDKMRNYVSDVSNRLASCDSVTSYSKLPDTNGEHIYVDITDAGPGTYYIDLDKFAGLKKSLANNGQAHFIKCADQKIVLTSRDYSVKLNKFDVCDSMDHYKSNKNITYSTDMANMSTAKNPLVEDFIFNFPNATSLDMSDVAGLFLAPKATVTFHGVGGGWLVCDTAISDAEWHFLNGKLPPFGPDKTTYTFRINKEYDGDVWPEEGFTFRIKAYPGDSNNTGVDPNAPMPCAVDKDGYGYVTIHKGNGNSASFGTVTFDAETIYKNGNDSSGYWGYDNHNKCYMYKIEEVIPENPMPGVTYDREPWFVKLWVNVAHRAYDNSYNITVDPKTARSVADDTICKPGDEQPVVFYNSYAEPPKAVLQGIKTVNGRVPTGDEKFEFTYQWYTKNDQWGPVVETVVNDGSAFAFPEMTLDFAKATNYDAGNVAYHADATEAHYFFKIVEKPLPTDSEYTYDPVAYIAKVTVKKNGKNYTTSYKYFRFDNPNDVSCKKYAQYDYTDSHCSIVDAMTFDNKRLGEISVHKVVTGVSDTNDTFYFTVIDNNGKKVADSNGKTVYSIKNGAVVTIKDLDPQKTYTVAECDANGNAINASTFAYEVSYSPETAVVDNLSSVNKADVTITNTPKEAAVSLKKVDAKTGAALQGVKFHLYKNGTTPVYVSNNNGEYLVATSGAQDIVTNASGELTIKGLSWGDYVLKEVATLDGYRYDSSIAMAFTVGKDGIVNKTTSSMISAVANGKYGIRYTVKNERKNFRLKIQKVYTSESGKVEYLNGAAFDLFYKENAADSDPTIAYKSGITAGEGELVFADLPYGFYKYVETSVPDGYTMTSDSTCDWFEINADSDVFTQNDAIITYKVNNKPIAGSVELTKVDDDKKPIAGVKFQLFAEGNSQPITANLVAGGYVYSANGMVYEFETDANGKISITNLPKGTYYFKETYAPSQYVYDATVKTAGFAIVNDNDNVKREVTNSDFAANVKFIKIDDATDAALNGVVFKLFKQDGTEVGEFTSANGGVVEAKNLAHGSYYFKEKSAPAGYKVLSENLAFDIPVGTANGATITLKNGYKKIEDGIAYVANERTLGKVTLQKLRKVSLNDDTTKGFAGVTFNLFDANNKPVYATGSNGAYVYSESKQGSTALVTYGAEGLLTVSNLPWGTYSFKEVKTDATDGVQVDENKSYPFVLNEQQLEVSFTGLTGTYKSVVNELAFGYVQLTKKDTNDKSLLNGVKFNLYKKSGELVGTYTTENGIIAKEKVGKLPFGEYYFVEIPSNPEVPDEAIPGYKLDTKHYEFTVSTQDETVMVEVLNERKLGSVELQKEDGTTNEKLDGAVFALYSDQASGLQNLGKIFGQEFFLYKADGDGTYTTSNGGKISVNNLPWGNYYFVEKTAPKGYVADPDTKYHFSIGPNTDSAVKLDWKLNVSNKPENGVIRVYKVDEEGNALAGAKFVLIKDGNRYPDASTVYTTGKDGYTEKIEVPWGTYHFIEVQAPEGYEQPPVNDLALWTAADLEKWSTDAVVINSTNTKATVESNDISKVNKKILGSLSLNKVDGSNQKLSGATFKLYEVDANGRETQVKTAGGNGMYSYSASGEKQLLSTNAGSLSVNMLPYGIYRVYEIDAPAGYEKNEAPYEFTISGQNDNKTYDFVNTFVKANVKFFKQDAAGNALAGAVFELYKKDSQGNYSISKGQVSSTSDGVVLMKDLEVGDYRFVEVSAPTGYVKKTDTEYYDFNITVADNGKTKTIANYDASMSVHENGADMTYGIVYNVPLKGRVKLLKKDGNGDALAGATFALYSSDDSLIMSNIVSDANGYVIPKAENDTPYELEWGSYYFKETKAPDGFVADLSKKYSFEITKENVSEDATVFVTTNKKGEALVAANTEIRGNAELIKKDKDTDKVLPGAVFAVYTDAATPVVVKGYESIVSNDEGHVLAENLTAGKYFFREISAPEGYEADIETKYFFEINAENNGKTVEAKSANGKAGIAYNTPIHGKVEVLKYFVDGGVKVLLSGAKFALEYRNSILGIKYWKAYNDVEYITGADGLINAIDLPWGEYRFVETVAPAGYVLPEKESDRVYEFTVNATSNDFTLTNKLEAENKRLDGSIGLIKTVTGSNRPVEGAAFSLYMRNSDGTADVTEIPNPNGTNGYYYTDAAGKITVDHLAWGTYYFYEESAPEGFALPAVRYTDDLVITADNVKESADAPITASVTNDEVFGDVRLAKIDEKDAPLAGAKFALYTKSGAAVVVSGSKGQYKYVSLDANADAMLLDTDDAGILEVKGLPYGEYKFIEKNAPAGYSIQTSEFPFTIKEIQKDESGKVIPVPITCINAKVFANVSFVKQDTSFKNLENIWFELWKVGAGENGADAKISDYASDKDGVVKAMNLTVGSYYFIEKTENLPDGARNMYYEPDTTRYTFTIKESDVGQFVKLDNAANNTVINTPKNGRVTLVKYYAENGTKKDTFNGAKFALYREDGTLVGEYIVGTDGPSGKIVVSDLAWGAYYFEEVSVPAGYSIRRDAAGNKLKYSFEINEANVLENVEVEAINDRDNGSLVIEKVDEDGAPLTGVTFALYRNYGKEDQELISEKKTEAGYATWDELLWGDYTLIETAFLEGYKDDVTVRRDFTIDATHKNKEYKGTDAIRNEKIKGYLELEKKDEQTNQPLESVQFKLYKETNEGKLLVTDQLFTNASGKLYQNGDPSDNKIGPLEKGKYVLEEVTPAGYLDGPDTHFEIIKNNDFVSYIGKNAITNTRDMGKAKLQKLDGNGAPLVGAKFTLYSTTPRTVGETIKSLFGADYFVFGVYTVSRTDGVLEFPDLPWDNYYVEETEAPLGYELDKRQVTFTIDAEHTFKKFGVVDLGTFNDMPKKGKAQLIKTDSATAAKLSGAKFKLYSVNGTQRADVSAQYGAGAEGKFVTDQFGEIKVENLEWGSYVFVETDAPAGYEPISDTNRPESKVFTIDASNANAKNEMQYVTVGVTNDKGYGYIKLIKQFSGIEEPSDLSGFEFDLLDENHKPIAHHKTDANGEITPDIFGKLPYGTYYIIETAVPVALSKDYPVSDFEWMVTIDKSNDANNIPEANICIYKNSSVRGKAKLIKTDAVGKPIYGIVFDLYSYDSDIEDAKLINSIASDNISGMVEATGLPMGNYYFKENAISANEAGYVADPTRYCFTITSDTADDYATITAEGSTVPVTSVKNNGELGRIQLIKLGRDSAGNELTPSIGDAEFELYKDGSLYMNRETLKQYVSDNRIVVGDLPWGEYYFVECKAPAGFAVPANPQTETITLNEANVFESMTTPLTATIKDDTIHMFISKQAIDSADELPGAELSIYNAVNGAKSGEALISWTSTVSPKLIDLGSELKGGLVAGNTYVLHEDLSPAGYSVAEDILFTVNADGTVTSGGTTIDCKSGVALVMKDAPIGVSVSKKDIISGSAVAGAKLVVKDALGNEIEGPWLSANAGDAHVIKAKLEVGAVYTLEEVASPKGYYKSAAINFTITKDGKVQFATSVGAEGSINGNVITMYDRPIDVEISKKRLSGSATDYVEGAKLALYDKLTKELVHSWTSTGRGAEKIPSEKLEVGRTYVVHETYAPVGYVIAKDIEFVVKDYNEFERTNPDGSVTQTVEMLDDIVKVEVSKIALGGKTELGGAKLAIYDAEDDTKAIAMWTSDANKATLITSISADRASAEEIEYYKNFNMIYNTALEAGKSYILRELEAPLGYAVAEDVRFTVNTDGTVTKVVMEDRPLELLLSKKDSTTGEYLSGATLSLIAPNKKEIVTWESSDKPVLVTIRDVDDVEAAKYEKVVKHALLKGETYVLHEVSAPEGYALADDIQIVIQGNEVRDLEGNVREESIYDVREGEIQIDGTKTWIVPRDKNGNLLASFKYPDIRIELYRDSSAKGVMDVKPYKTFTLKNGATNYSFSGLEKYKYKAGSGVDYEYTYTVKENMDDVSKANFTAEQDGYNFTNRLKQEYTDIYATKFWLLFRDEDGNIDHSVDYEDVIVYLTQDGKHVDIDGDGKDDCVVVKNGAVDKDGEISFTFDNLPKYDLTTGREYEYGVDEPIGTGKYDNEISVSEHIAKVYNIPFSDPFRISGKKQWIDPIGTEHPVVTIELYRDGKFYKSTKLNDDYTFSFDNLLEFNMGWGYKMFGDPDDRVETADGHRYVYTLKEVGADNYSLLVDFNGEITTLSNGERVSDAALTNTIKQEFVELEGAKFWNDNGDASKRPSVTVNLYATDSDRTHELVDTYVIPNTSQTYTFGKEGQKKLEKYDSKGQIIKYSVEEESLDGYISKKDGEFNFINTPSKTRIRKADASTGAELPGAVMALIRISTGVEVERWTSTTTPHYIEGLAMGERYRLIEISAPRGYGIADPIEFVVNSDGVEQSITMDDPKIVGSVTLTKRDASTRDVLAGAIFNLYTEGGALVSTTGSMGDYTYTEGAGTSSLAVNAAGELTVKELPFGTYYFKEVTPPTGYVLSTEGAYFTIAEAGASTSVTFLNERGYGSARLTKASSTLSTSLAGAVFELYSKTPQTPGQAIASTIYGDPYYRVGTYTTGAFGDLFVDGLPWGDYYFIEVQAPEGYQLNLDVNGDPIVYPFTVDASSAATVSIGMGLITNTPEGGGGRTTTRLSGGVLSGVLGVRAAPSKGVLGVRVGPVTGDASNIALWILLLAACVAAITGLLITNRRRRKAQKK